MRGPLLHTTLERPTIEEVELTPKMIVIEDSSKEDLKMTRGRPMVVDNDEELQRGLKRQSEEHSNDGDPFIFKHMKEKKDWGHLGGLKGLRRAGNRSL